MSHVTWSHMRMTYASTTDEPCQTGARVIQFLFCATSQSHWVRDTYMTRWVREGGCVSKQQIHQKIRICITTYLYVSSHMYVYTYINIRCVVKTWARREGEWLFDQRLEYHIQQICIFMCTSYWIYRSVGRAYVSILQSRVTEHVCWLRKMINECRNNRFRQYTNRFESDWASF